MLSDVFLFTIFNRFNLFHRNKRKVILIFYVMNAKEKAIQLVNKFRPFVNGYVGSSMLTNTEYPETILSNAKKLAIISVDEILEALLETLDG